MSINLQKGQRISLAKESPGLTRVMCGLGWDVMPKQGGILALLRGSQDCDLDASVICLDANERVNNAANVIYFGNLNHTSDAITHLGDNLTGEGSGDDEQVLVDLAKVPGNIHKLVFVVNIYECAKRKQDFSQIRNAFVRLVDLADNREIARYNLSGADYADKTGAIMAEIYRQDGDWKMVALGTGVNVNSLQDWIRRFA